MAPRATHSKEIFGHIRTLMQSAVRLSLGAKTTATACAFFHRFCRECGADSSKEGVESFPKEYDAPLVSATCLYLAGKATEEHVKIRDVLNVTYVTTNDKKPPLEVGEKYWLFREAIVRCELFLIRVLGFNLRVDLPHTYLCYHLRSLTQWIFADVDRRDSSATALADKRLAALTNACWSVLRDCYHSASICLDVDPSHLSIAIIFLSLECYGIEVPLNRVDGTPWFIALSDDISLGRIQNIVLDIIGLYETETLC